MLGQLLAEASRGPGGDGGTDASGLRLRRSASVASLVQLGALAAAAPSPAARAQAAFCTRARARAANGGDGGPGRCGDRHRPPTGGGDSGGGLRGQPKPVGKGGVGSLCGGRDPHAPLATGLRQRRLPTALEKPLTPTGPLPYLPPSGAMSRAFFSGKRGARRAHAEDSAEPDCGASRADELEQKLNMSMAGSSMQLTVLQQFMGELVA